MSPIYHETTNCPLAVFQLGQHPSSGFFQASTKCFECKLWALAHDCRNNCAINYSYSPIRGIVSLLLEAKYYNIYRFICNNEYLK